MISDRTESSAVALAQFAHNQSPSRSVSAGENRVADPALKYASSLFVYACYSNPRQSSNVRLRIRLPAPVFA